MRTRILVYVLTYVGYALCALLLQCPIVCSSCNFNYFFFCFRKNIEGHCKLDTWPILKVTALADVDSALHEMLGRTGKPVARFSSVADANVKTRSPSSPSL